MVTRLAILFSSLNKLYLCSKEKIRHRIKLKE